MTQPSAIPGSETPSTAIGPVAFAIMAFGIALRFALLLSGRSPIDGDEAMMGMMAYHGATLREIPLYFYGQHYMGTIELPLVALLQRLGPEAWAFSIWPIRIVEAVYFVGFGIIHTKLITRLFGKNLALWSLFFLCVGPLYWMDYSQRLRHVVFMMMVGEGILLVGLGVIDAWNEKKKLRPSRIVLIGFLIGLEWWHYQLILVFVLTLGLLFFACSSYLGDLFRKPVYESGLGANEGTRSRFDPVSAFLAVAIGLCLALLAGLSMGWLAASWERFGIIIFGTLTVLGLASAAAWQLYLSERAAWVAAAVADVSPWIAVQRLSPCLFALGFVLGNAPALFYLARLDEEFWIARTFLDLPGIAGNLRSVFMMEIASMLDLTRPLDWTDPADQEIWSLTAVHLGLYALGGLLLIEKLLRPAQKNERIGAVVILGFTGVLLTLRVAFPRHTPWTEPRFIVPLFITTSVMLGLVANTFVQTLTATNSSKRTPIAAVLSLLIVLGSLGLWGTSWRRAVAYETDPATGHRVLALAVAETLEANGIQRLYIEYAPGAGPTGWIPFGWELTYASAMRLRLHWGTFDDRLWGHVDESRYGRNHHFMYVEDARSRDVGSAPQEVLDELPGFSVRGYRIVPLPPKYTPKGGWRGEQRGTMPELPF